MPAMAKAHPAGVPVSTVIMGGLALVLLGLGTALAAGAGRDWHPLLAQGDAGLAFIVSGVALALGAAFPLVLRRLAAADAPRQ
jgi:hypothetical protein